MEIDNEQFWKRVRALLTSKGFTFKGMCNDIGLPYSTMYKQTSTKTIPAKFDQICAMSKYLGISLDELVYGKTSVLPVYPPRVQAIADKLMKVSSVDLESVERIVTLMSEEKKNRVVRTNGNVIWGRFK